MNKLKIYCFVTNESKFLKKLPANIVPVIIGNNNSTTFLSENVGINISNLNKYYAELTGLYWVFKNRIEYHNDDDFVGFCHYRRLWMNGILNKKISFSNIYSKLLQNKNKSLNNFETILVDPIYLKNESIIGHFNNNHGKEIFEFLHKILDKNLYNDFINYGNQKKFSPCNMFITKPKIFINYCNLIFPLMEKLLEECLNRNLCIGNNLKLPAYFIERFTPYWFKKHSKVGYLSYAVLNNFYMSDAVNNIINPLKLPFTSSFFPTKLDI
ncbi:DUF4422 domain-containing protein [Candidatus Pelagibacter ubique]|nr:DUF4422 domain-containing protein [Candidatus Pelagibacter ubique]